MTAPDGSTCGRVGTLHPVEHMALERVDSTNAEATRLATAGGRGPLWITAVAQTAGRGRAGRGWSMPAGNLAATYLSAPALPPAKAAQCGFVAALAVGHVLEALCPHTPWQVKWPNDVLLGGRKVAGILLETSGAGAARIDWLAIGIGLNLIAAPPPEALRPGGWPATSIAAEGGDGSDRERALDLLADGVALFMARLLDHGFGPVRRAWLAHAHALGDTVSAQDGRIRRQGIFADMDADGCLVLDGADGRRHRIAAGDVHFPE
ncbi:MAG: biotin--[acetyl-CoA-carboxylase] ligase [Pseudomonadota bacterium]